MNLHSVSKGIRTRVRDILYAGLLTLGIALLSLPPAASASVNVFVQPPGLSVFVSSNATFTATATATGGETITGYTWLMSTNNQNPFITVATGPTLNLINVQNSDMGYYFVRVAFLSGTNPGAAVSTSVLLTVVDRARITGQPVDLTRIVGSNASFSITAVGSQPLTYQWRHDGVGLADDARISGSTTSNLNVVGLLTNDAGNYDIVVANAYGAVTSAVANLIVQVPPFFSVPPQDTAVIVGSNATLSATVGGTAPYTFQWQKDGTNLNDGGRISGSATDTLTIATTVTNDSANYTLLLSNAVGSTSAVARLSVLVLPVITSAATTKGTQGFAFSYSIKATGSPPILFGADGLPDGLSVDPTNGLISGIPSVFGVFHVPLYATNPAATATRQLTLTLITDVPGITNTLLANGQQGTNFTFTIGASNNPVFFSATGLPLGVSLDPLTGILSGPPVVSGVFPVTITAGNQYGSDTKTLVLNIASSVPVITSALTATGTENQAGFLYTITANNGPTQFGASGLPSGLLINTNTGVIHGIPTYGGTNNVVIWARNAWGTGSNTLQLLVQYVPLVSLTINNVLPAYSKPYLLDFSFSLQDDSSGNAVVRPPSQVQVVCLEDGVPIGDETAFIVDRGDRKQLKTYFALDYSYSMFIMPGAIDTMETAVGDLIDQESPSAQFGVYEFHADFAVPKQVTGFTTDKAALKRTISGIRTNFVQNNYGGTRCWDTVNAALQQFGPTNTDEQRFLIIMTDGNDDSSLLNTNGAPVALLVNNALSAGVRLYCVAFGNNVNTPVLQQLTTGTSGRYFLAETPADLPIQFALLLKDIRAQYLLRWATLKRAPAAFQPMFRVTVDGITADYNTAVVIQTNVMVDTNTMPPSTNITTTNLSKAPLYTPPSWAADVHIGGLRLLADAVTNATSVTLRAAYVPRFVRSFHLHYTPNWPCTAVLDMAGPGEPLNGWSLTETNDGTGGRWLTLLSPSPTNSLTSLPYGILGDLVTFKFQFNQLPNQLQAFGLFSVDNSIYSNLPPIGQSFVLSNASSFVTVYPAPPPHGTPVPWLISYGFSGDFAAAELSDPNGNGLPTWQDYLAGLNPTNPAAMFLIRPVSTIPLPSEPHFITFPTVATRTYRVDTTLDLINWMILLDGIGGTGEDVTVSDNRDLSGVATVYYRVVVY